MFGGSCVCSKEHRSEMAETVDLKSIRSEKVRALAVQLWAGSQPIILTPAGHFLWWLGVSPYLLRDTRDVRFHPTCAFDLKDRARGPALLALVRDANNEVTGIHIKGLPEGNGSAPVETSEHQIGDVGTSAVRLMDYVPYGPLVLGEGLVDTFAAATLWGAPAWALTSPEAFENVSFPFAASRLLIAAAPGAEARERAERLAGRLRGRSHFVEVRQAPDGQRWRQMLPVRNPKAG